MWIWACSLVMSHLFTFFFVFVVRSVVYLGIHGGLDDKTAQPAVHNLDRDLGSPAIAQLCMPFAPHG
jgi:hypothetical protein